MTRFARAKGSKSSNERVEEDATSWAEMKQQLESKKQEIENKPKQKEAEKKRQENYNKFLQETESEKSQTSTWSDFPNTITQQKKTKEQSQTKLAKSPAKINEKIQEVQNTPQSKNQTKAQKRKQITDKKLDKSKKAKVKETVAPTPKKKVEEMTEDEVKKFEKYKNKKLKQLEKKKLKKQKLKEEKEALAESTIQETKVSSNESKQPKFAKTNKITKSMPPKVKKFDKEYKRRKPQESESQKIKINGKEIEIVKFDGFPIKKEDAERLQILRKQMISKGLPRSEVQTALKLERRRAEKALARDKKNVCYNCRMAGHVLAECPNIGDGSDNVDTTASGICFKCGSTEHTHFECKVVKNQEFRFASCFICKEQGHISWQCPDNARGLYPKGGACKLCGDVTHLKKDCPKYVAEQKANEVSLDMLTESSNPDVMDQTSSTLNISKNTNRPNKIIKF